MRKYGSLLALAALLSASFWIPAANAADIPNGDGITQAQYVLEIAADVWAPSFTAELSVPETNATYAQNATVRDTGVVLAFRDFRTIADSGGR
jgi:hypothetical protein